MGAWGSGSFENDIAMDWAAEIQSVADVRKPFERLKQDTDAAEEGPTSSSMPTSLASWSQRPRRSR